MSITEVHVKQFQTIYFQQFGEEISYEEAYEKGMKLLQMMQTIYKPMTQEEYEMIQAKIKILLSTQPPLQIEFR